MSNYATLSSTSYPYNNEYQISNNHPMRAENSSQQVFSVSPSLQQGLMSINQPDTPRPEGIQTPPLSEKMEVLPNLIRKNTLIPSRSASFSTFHSNPYPRASPVRRRRTESIFSFEVGPTFKATNQTHELYNIDQSNGYQVQLHAKIDRGFFRADQDWTCYRRNYFQVSSTFEIHGLNYLMQGPEVPCLLRKTNTQEFFQVDYFSIGISARVINNDKKIELVQHTPKRDKGPQIVPEPRPVRSGGSLHLASVGSNHNIITFERLQFKTATANNGKRRAAQQYYEIVVSLYANVNTKEPICVATSISSPLVVRGRSPGHYSDSHTRFRGMDSDSNNLNGHILPVPMGGNSAQQNSPGHQFGSLPNSPLSDFGPYSYNNYQYQYSSIIPSSSPSSQYTSHPVSSTDGQQSYPYATNEHNQRSHLYSNNVKPTKDDEQRNTYWPQQSPKINNSQTTPSHISSGMPYMGSMEPYTQTHDNRSVGYSSGPDAGRSQ